MLPTPVDPKQFHRLIALSQVGMEMVAPIVMGWFLDGYMGWSPWGVVVGAILGLVGGMAHLLQLSTYKPLKRPKPPESSTGVP